ncbi:MAG TPA: transaldolase family protein, partial [Candidatus Woesebacteria bacterium]|nr:transaldolase family protein [Candidatus Woesebacteria bacterium]
MSIKLPKIFLDSGDPEETKKAKGLIRTIDGQTTNPSLVVKNPEIQKYVEGGKKLTEAELLGYYKQIIQELDKELAGPISVETYADWNTKASDMLKQAEDMVAWGRNIYIKFPTIPEGVRAAHEFVQKGGCVNMTLVFTQEQAAAVFAATLPTTQQCFISPFIGRWDDRGYEGLDLVKNMYKMYKKFGTLGKSKIDTNHTKTHVSILAASIRNLDHFYASIFMGADILTVPMSILRDWVQEEKWIPDEHYRIPSKGLKSLVYQDIPFSDDFSSYKIDTEKGS